MDAFATKGQMEEKSKGLIPASTPFLEDELAAASRVIRNYCRWHIATSEQGLKYRHRSRLREEVWIPASQIAAITAASIDGRPVEDLGSIDVDAETGWTSLRGSAVDLTYTAGYETVPEDIVVLTLKLASRALGNPLDVIRQQVATASVAYSQVAPNVAAGGSLLPHEFAQLDAYRVGWIG